jgi:hypothetical protein
MRLAVWVSIEVWHALSVGLLVDTVTWNFVVKRLTSAGFLDVVPFGSVASSTN